MINILFLALGACLFVTASDHNQKIEQNNLIEKSHPTKSQTCYMVKDLLIIGVNERWYKEGDNYWHTSQIPHKKEIRSSQSLDDARKEYNRWQNIFEAPSLTHGEFEVWLRGSFTW